MKYTLIDVTVGGALLLIPLAASAETARVTNDNTMVKNEDRDSGGPQRGTPSNTNNMNQGDTNNKMNKDGMHRTGTGSVDASRINLSVDAKNDIKEVLRDVVHTAIDGDIEDVVDYLAEADNKRMESEANVRDNDAIEKSSETFRTAWKNSHDRSFSDSLDKDALRVEFVSGTTDKSAIVRVSDGNESTELRLVNQGVLTDAWRINTPDNLSQSELQRQLERALTDGSSRKTPQQVALQVLRPLGQPMNQSESVRKSDS